MAQTVQKTETAPQVETRDEARPRQFALSTEEIRADVRRNPLAYVKALKVETDGE